MQIIIDINGKERNIKDNFKVVTYNRKNDVTTNTFENVDGELITTPEVTEVEVDEKYLEVTIIGKNREWTEWYPLGVFEKLNPEFILMDEVGV